MRIFTEVESAVANLTVKDRDGPLGSLMSDEDESPFVSHDGRWYADEDRLRMRMMRYAVERRELFR